jgi:hypothetical protein
VPLCARMQHSAALRHVQPIRPNASDIRVSSSTRAAVSLLLPALPPRVRALRVEDPQPFRREVLAVTRPDRTPSTRTVIAAIREEAARLINSQ